MSDARTMEALASAIYMSRLALKGEGADTDDKKIRASGLYEDWQPGKHSTGEIYNAAGLVLFGSFLRQLDVVHVLPQPDVGPTFRQSADLDDLRLLAKFCDLDHAAVRSFLLASA